MNKLAGNMILLTAMAAMLLPSLYSNLLQIERCVTKILAHERLETSHLETIRIATADLQWYEEGKELVYNKQLFDVESFFIQDDTAIITGLTDSRETEIDLAVNKLVHNSGFDFVIATVGENIFDFTAFQPTHINFQLLLEISQEPQFYRYHNAYSPLIYKLVQTPPPDFLSL